MSQHTNCKQVCGFFLRQREIRRIWSCIPAFSRSLGLGLRRQLIRCFAYTELEDILQDTLLLNIIDSYTVQTWALTPLKCGWSILKWRKSCDWKLKILKALRVNLKSLVLKRKWKTYICSRVLSPLYQCRSQPKKEKDLQRPSWRQAPRQVWWTSTYTSMIDKNLDKYQRRSQDTITS